LTIINEQTSANILIFAFSKLACAKRRKKIEILAFYSTQNANNYQNFHILKALHFSTLSHTKNPNENHPKFIALEPSKAKQTKKPTFKSGQTMAQTRRISLFLVMATKNTKIRKLIRISLASRINIGQ
jgi:hypothetical protein